MRCGRIKYAGYYDTQPNASENRYYVLAASDKMDYILGTMRSGPARYLGVAASLRPRFSKAVMA